MGNLLFSPSGRITPDEFMKGAYVLIAISFVLGVLPLVSYTLGSALGLLGIILIWCWIVLFIKRLHDGGKSGWLCLLPILAFIVATLIISNIVTAMFAGDLNAQLQDAAASAAESGDFGEAMKAGMEMGQAIARKTALPMAIAGAAVSFGIAYVFNMLVKRDGDNQYGPA